MDSNRNTRWLEDINFLSRELSLKHKNLFFQKNKEDFFKEIDSLKTDIESLSNYEIKLEIAKIVASMGDAHTYVPLNINLLLPLELYWFADGIYVIVAPQQYKEILYRKIIKINNIDIEEVINILSSIISYENETYLKSQLPKYFPAIELLYDLGLVNDIDSLELTFEDKNKKEITLEIKSMPLGEWKELYNLINNDLMYSANLPLYRRNSHKNYWFEYIDASSIVYFKYNACKDMPPKDVVTFCSELISFIEAHVVEKLIIDLRNNFGGNSSLLNPFIEYIINCDKINKTGNLFIIIGRETFSSALLNSFFLKENTSAIFLGEPTGGKPNCYGEVERFILKNSGLTVCYSTEYYKIVEDDTLLSLLPDVNIEFTIQNYINNEDPCFEYINKKDS
ncbi:S41 family peptidase [Clostridium tagluense]|uniref:S41 family peptidase n=1 Tax=Clostridium tagluense TaxID=360422 RepID=UPI001CF34943|nr:S41 family peptidase [Clostridium tagluense]MCB2309675.1 S41 family peptidase [Clostridium tagluense]MCB2314795.1 S41 family peptidase [Clostridium tagluense]MCB2319644.1 S41 family peptidase [Clostridium tagluense]MCB2324269.1 S41 family peptidase [Clostridium tagluense]MCB2329120.1 S41 family peptidase [Clostridium tagluense]